MTKNGSRPSGVSPDLLDAYRKTSYRFEHGTRVVTLRIGKPSGELRALQEAHAAAGSAYITACNPYSQPLSDEENARRNQNLRTDLQKRGFTVFAGEGVSEDGRWREGSFLVLGIGEEEAFELARRYGQNAFLWIGPDALPQLRLVEEAAQ